MWNSSAWILSPQLVMFVVMLPKAHLTLHSRMSGSRWVIIASWLSGSWRSVVYSCSVYSCHLFLISLLVLSPYHFCPLLCPSLQGWCFSSSVSCVCAQSMCSVLSDCVWLHGLKPVRLRSPWNFSGENPGVGCHFPLQRIFLTEGWNPPFWSLLRCQGDFFFFFF